MNTALTKKRESRLTIGETHRITNLLVKQEKQLLQQRDKLCNQSTPHSKRDKQKLRDVKFSVLQSGNLKSYIQLQINKRNIIGVRFQNGDLDNTFFSEVKNFINSLPGMEKPDFVISIVHFLIDLMLSESKLQFLSAAVHFLRDIFRNKDSLIDAAMNYFKMCMLPLEVNIQSGELFGEETINNIWDLFKIGEGCQKSKVWKAIVDFFNYLGCLIIGIFSGEKDDPNKFGIIRNLITTQEEVSGPLIFKICSNLIFLMKQGYQSYHVGYPMSFFFTETSFAKWYEESKKVQLSIMCINSPDRKIQRNRKDVLRELQDLVARGNQMKPLIGESEKRILVMELHKITIEAHKLHTNMVQSKIRAAPLTLLINGNPSVGKTSFMKDLEVFYAQCSGLEINDDSRYVRQFCDPFWSGMKTSVWCVILDDIAFENPNKVTSLKDSSTSDVIQIANNMVFSPNMANLEEKGTVFCMPDLVLASTNCKSLNAHALFQTPHALLRRFPYVMTIFPKKEYSTSDGRLDSALVPLGETDLWKIEVEIPTMQTNSGTCDTHYDPNTKKVFESQPKFLEWFKSAIEKHKLSQEKVLQYHENASKRKYCMNCFKLICECVEIQNGVSDTSSPDVLEEISTPEEVIPDPIPWGEPMSWKQYCKWKFNQFKDKYACYGDGDYDIAAVETFKNYIYQLGIYCVKAGTHHLHFWIYSLLLLVFLPITGFFSLVPLCYSSCIYFAIVSYHAYHYWCYMLHYLTLMGINIFVILPLRWQLRVLLFLGKWKVDTMVQTQAKFLAYAKGLLALLAVYKMGSMALNFHRVRKQAERELEQSEAEVEVENAPVSKEVVMQGSSASKDVYYQSVEKAVSWDFGSCVSSWKSLSKDEVVKIISKNVVRLHGKNGKTGHGFYIKDQVLITNNHLFGKCRTFRLLDSENATLCSAWFTISNTDVYEDPMQDLMAIRLRNFPPRKNLMNLLPKVHLEELRSEGVIISRVDNTCELNIYHSKCLSFEGESFTYDTNPGSERTPHLYTYYHLHGTGTRDGDCGSPYVAFTPSGPTIVAIHQAMGPDYLGGIALTYNAVEEMTKNFSYGIQGGSLVRDTMSFEMTSWSPDSNLRRIKDPHVYIFGSSGRRFPSKSKVMKSLIYDECVNAGMVDIYDKPLMRDRQVWINQAQPMVERDFKINHDLLDRAVEMYVDEVVEVFSEVDISEVRILTDDEAINGIDGVDYVDKIPRKTSAGFPYNTSKQKFLTVVDQKAIVDNVIMDDFRAIEQLLLSGTRSMPIFMGNLKDEVITHEKRLNKKTRVFTGSPFAFSIAMRKYLLTVNALLQKNRDLCECYVGLDPLGPQWHVLHERLKNFSPNFIAGDYKAYDKKMDASLILAAGVVVRKICARANYSENQLLAVSAIFNDLAFPISNFDGDIIMTCGAEPSGHPLTVIVNSIVGSLLLRMAFATLQDQFLAGNSFKREICALIYGDDNVVASKNQFFTHTFLQDFFQTQGMVYTMADKKAESIPFIPLTEVTFLKRDFFHHPQVGKVVGRLDITSIYKALMYVIPSRSVDANNQLVDTLDTTCREMFFHGKEMFEKHRSWALNLIEIHELHSCVRKSDFPPYLELFEWYMDKWEELNRTFIPESVINTNGSLARFQGGCIDHTSTICHICKFSDCVYHVSDAIICKRCLHCRTSRLMSHDRWFLGCLYCETEQPMRCDFCYNPRVTTRKYQLDGYTVTLLCERCSYNNSRSAYIVPNWRSNGPYRSDRLLESLASNTLSDGENEDSSDLQVSLREEYSL